MAKINYRMTILIDAAHSAFHFYSMIDDDVQTIKHHIKNYTGRLFSDEFFKRFKKAVKEFADETPSDTVRKVTVVLPDCAVVTDTVKIPALRGFGQTRKTLEAALGSLYRNYNDLGVQCTLLKQNKAYSTFAIVAAKKQIISSIFAACSENRLLVDTLTYASGTAVCAASMIEPKLKNASYLFLDVKDVYSRFVFVADGKTVGYYTLPFGLEFLRKPKVVQEDMLFDHSYAELTVLNAQEKAKSKKLTVMGQDYNDAVLDSEDDDDDADEVEEVEEVLTPAAEEAEGEQKEAEDTAAETAAPATAPVQKVFTKKQPRKLPKFMLRPVPETKEGVLYENFRVLVKWALTLLQGNAKLVEIGKPEYVCVNLPSDLAPVLDAVNEEKEENGIPFIRLPETDGEKDFSEHLELFGGLYPKQINPAGKF